jgi:glucose-1-phosphatase
LTALIPPRCVVLDMGNVLIFHDNELLFRELGRLSGRTTADVKRLVAGSQQWREANLGTLDAEGIYRAMSRNLGWETSFETFSAVWSCHFKVHTEVLPLVEGLLGRVKVIALSNTNALHVLHCTQALPLLKRFDHVLFSNELHLEKPDPRFFQRALSLAEVEPHEAVFFDDLVEYVRAAQALGMQARVFTTAEAFAKDLAALGL